MSLQHLSVYLNDHLAGASTGLELIDILRGMKGLDQWAAELGRDIAADREELEQLMRTCQVARGTMRQAAGWVAGRVAELKTRLDDEKGGPLQRLEILEVLALGIDGKRALWTGLEAASAYESALRALDYPRLIARATEQRQRVEIRRRAAAVEAFAAMPTHR
jgi:hypothetical protein